MEMFIIFLSLVISTSGFDYFQGVLELSEACFDVYNHKQCNCNIEDVFTPSHTAPASNKPATKFFLFTPESKDKAEQIHKCGGRLPPRSKFNISCPTEVLIHGYSDGVCRTAWMRETKEQYFQKSSCFNVILVDWTWGNLIDIAAASQNAKGVGEQVAYVLKNISKQKKYNTTHFHIVGHSYGATAASFAGKNMQDPSYRLGRLTGLEFPLPPFLNAPAAERLNPGDALFVDVVHTNTGDCFPFNLGDSRPMGHVDMYLNDNTHQYSCHPYALISFLKLDYLYALATLLYPALCYHTQALQYYKTSINADKDNSFLIGVICDSYEDFVNGKCPRNCEAAGTCAPLGFDLPDYIDTSDTRRKIYQVPTSLTCPYTDHSGFTGLPLKPIK